MLSYKLYQVIQTYSENKPTLVFCSTRKSAVQTACTLSKTAKFVYNANHKVILIDAANRIHDCILKESILSGIGFHHGGLDVSDRRLIENMFLSSQLLVLVSTSTLSMGVNFPAHLVVIKSTSQYVTGCYKEYSDTQVLQMIGRAGRPQFDRNATAVIMTKSSLQAKYESLVNGTQLIESSLHKHMAEHLNAEIVLHSITDISIAMEWLKATFLYQRVFKNPKYYGMNADLPRDKIERKLQDICIKELNGLRKYELIFMDDDSFHLEPTKSGRLMAKYYIAYETMKQFSLLTGNESLAEMISLLSSCKEFDDIQLRVNEKRSLNDLNKNKISSIRFPLQGKIKTKQMKINCLIQATFGCLMISESSLNQDIARIFQNAPRVSKCLVEYLSANKKGFTALYSAVVLSKCFKARLWENSKFVSRQLEKIGVAFSNILVNAGITTIEDILKTNPREIELILKRNPPFGNGVIDSARQIPKYSLQVEQNLPINESTASLSITVKLENIDDVLDGKNKHSGCYILIGDVENNTILFEKIGNTMFCREQYWMKKVSIAKSGKGSEINIFVINDTFVGMDVYKSYSVIYENFDKSQTLKKKIEVSTGESMKKKCKAEDINPASETRIRNCNHKCINKGTCCHSCCKVGVVVTIPKKNQLSNFMEQLQNKINDSPEKIKIGVGTFSESIKMFERSHYRNNIFVNTCTNSKEKRKSISPQQCSSKEGGNDYTNHYAYKEHDERQKEELLLRESCEKDQLENLSFDVNFKTNFSEKNSFNEFHIIEQSVKPPGSTPKFELFPQKHHNSACKLKKWDDPIAAEETFNLCLDFLSNNY